MSIMVFGNRTMLGKLTAMLMGTEFNRLFYYDSDGGNGVPMPLLSLVPFVDLVVMEKTLLYGGNTDLSEALLREAVNVGIPVLTEDTLNEVLAGCGF